MFTNLPLKPHKYTYYRTTKTHLVGEKLVPTLQLALENQLINPTSIIYIGFITHKNSYVSSM